MVRLPDASAHSFERHLRGVFAQHAFDTHRATAYHEAMKTALLCGPIVPSYGPVPSNLYVLGERAGKTEHDQGRPFVGGAGQTLRKWFDDAKLDLDNYRRWNVCIDYQPDNPPPRRSEIERDREEVEADIVRCQPNVIVAVGVHAMRWCLQGLKTRPNLGDVHGRKFEVQIGDHKPVCVPIYHPSTYGRIERAEMGKADVLTVARVLRGLIA
jgi:uracil-DNA glycosylase family 4